MFQLGEMVQVILAADSNMGRKGVIRSHRMSRVAPSPEWEVMLFPLPGNPFTSAWYDSGDLQKVP